MPVIATTPIITSARKITIGIDEAMTIKHKLIISHVVVFIVPNTLENDFVYFEKQTYNGKDYQLYFVSKRSIHDEDKALEAALQNTIYFVVGSLIIFVLATSWLLARFILKKIALSASHK